MVRILFVEDNLELVEELAELIVLERPDTKIDFSVDLPTAFAKLNSPPPFDIAILDIMLPAYPDVPPGDEGLYLAAWILGKTDNLPASMKSHKRSPSPTTKVIFLTSRARAGVQDTWAKLVSDMDLPTFIERLRGDAYEHYQQVIAPIIGEVVAGAETETT